ncbi:SprT-like protein [Granulicatella balaenopterae]|uniref:SprT-like protein n=1 Tax=Granulicatella balaenopterae TaxID=137733 RepID=A0A1H9JY25_9LACT|nr:SprT family protein [Granulicatella balaenopterae]SEQ91856.1 SprT-like protein [Granulicatella balaenopterae]
MVNKDQALQDLVESISMRYFRRKFKHKAFYNPRLKTTGGRYHLRSGDIDINPLVEEMHGREELVGVIKHELCHYHLHQQGMPYQHRDQEFKLLLRQVGGSRYVKDMRTNKEYRLLYQCVECQTEYFRQRKLNTKRYACGKCRGKLVLVQDVLS